MIFTESKPRPFWPYKLSCKKQLHIIQLSDSSHRSILHRIYFDGSALTADFCFVLGKGMLKDLHTPRYWTGSEMTGKVQADSVQSRHAAFVRCCPWISCIRPPRKLTKCHLPCLFYPVLWAVSLKYIQYSCGHVSLHRRKYPAESGTSPVFEEVYCCSRKKYCIQTFVFLSQICQVVLLLQLKLWFLKSSSFIKALFA